jgi:predicted histidine transporter YuiF (NhaC family)
MSSLKPNSQSVQNFSTLRSNMKSYIILGITILVAVIAAVFVVYNINKPKQDKIEENKVIIDTKKDKIEEDSKNKQQLDDVPQAPTAPMLDIPKSGDIKNQ